MKVVHFWSHERAPDGQLSVACFSQWWPSPFQAEGHAFTTAEQYMMFRKAALFGDERLREKILKTKSPLLAMEMGRLVAGFDDAKWNCHKFAAVCDGNFFKFSQSSALKQFLLDTADAMIAYSSPSDTVWGTGLAAEDEKANKPPLWPGKNLLGQALMQVRSRLKNDSTST